MSSTVLGREKKDSLILQRIYDFKDSHHTIPDSVEDHVYAKFRFNVERRNPTLWLIPTLYVLAKDERTYIRESYNHINYFDQHKVDIKSQVLSGTIRHNRRAMPTLKDLLTPDIYDAMLYDGRVLSPFNRHNRRHYKFSQSQISDSTIRLDFRPKFYNTQLINGYAIVDSKSGHIIRTVMNGEFDMISYRTEIYQSDEEWPLPTPKRCTTAATFNFLGNKITAVLEGYFNCEKTLPDTLGFISDRQMMDSLRVISLNETDKRIYAEYDLKHQEDTVVLDTIPQKNNLLKKIFWDTIGESLITPIAAESENASFRLSPLIDPLQLSWSDRRGFRYKMNIRSQYTFSPHRYLTFNPRFGYNFKFREFYFTMPLRMTYNPKRNGYAEIVYGNGNRISNGQVVDAIMHQYGDTIHFHNTDIDKFTDNHLLVFNNIMLFDWFDIESGFVYHRRRAINKDFMHLYGMPIEYRSFAPMIGLKISPWLSAGPLFSFDWERGITGVNKSDIKYERFEFDTSWKYNLPGLRVFNMRTGFGFYGHREQNYFVDYTNFRDNNLPGGWDDDWSGNFELLRGEVYNLSNYYLRANVSYDSPLMIATWIPYLGKYIERERFYFGAASMEHSKPYFELGYSFTNRYISIAMFAGFNGTKFKEIGFDFSYELFRRW
jgi:hypothetical protein